MKLRERDEPMDPGAERELDAVERALAGGSVDPDLTDWAELAQLLRDERPEPRREWSAGLDERAADRFGRGGGSPGAFAARLRGLAPAHVAGPLGAMAALAIVVVVAISTVDTGGDRDESASSADSSAMQALEPATGTGASGDDAGVLEAAPDSSISSPPSVARGDRLAPGTERRQVDRDVQLQLSARPDEVRGVTDEAIAITRGLDGIVVSSQVTEAGRQASATLQLTIPTRNLDAALDGLTGLANVESLNETALDITRPYVSAQDRLEDAEAERLELLEALGNASTDAEAQALRLQIDDARAEISAAEAAFENIARRARLSEVNLSITGDPDADGAAGGRDLGDWLDDAVSVLRDVAGVLLIAAAVLVPLGILIAIGWFAASLVRCMRRARALDA